MQISGITYLVALLFSGGLYAQSSTEKVQVSGAMRNVMRKGELHGTIHLDTMAHKTHLYGLGPKEYLKGELLLIDGQSYVSTVNADASIRLEETYDVKAPFFVYANCANWKSYPLPTTIRTMAQLEAYIDQLAGPSPEPFVFKVTGHLAQVNFHTQNLPDGTIVRSPEDAHTNQAKYLREQVDGTLVGFFSRHHQTIFTHHDTFMHMHYINELRTEMGHVDDVQFDGVSNLTLYVPIERN